MTLDVTIGHQTAEHPRGAPSWQPAPKNVTAVYVTDPKDPGVITQTESIEK